MPALSPMPLRLLPLGGPLSAYARVDGARSAVALRNWGKREEIDSGQRPG